MTDQALDNIRREKVNLENTLEQEQEALVNRMWKRLDKLEHEKKFLQGKLNLNSAPPSPMDVSVANDTPRSARNSLMTSIAALTCGLVSDRVSSACTVR